MKSLALLLLASATALTGCTEDAPPTPTPLTCPEALVVTSYRIDRLEVANNAVDAAKLGLDLDGDGSIDNQAGNLLSTAFVLLADQDAATRYDAQLDARLAGELDWELELSTCRSTGESQLTPINDVVPLGALTDLTGSGDEDWHPITASAITFQLSRTGISGRLGYALAPRYADVVARGFVPLLDERIADRAQVDGSDIVDFIDGIDANRDDHVAEIELQVAPIFTTMTDADVDTDDDGKADSLSLGLGFHATAIP